MMIIVTTTIPRHVRAGGLPDHGDRLLRAPLRRLVREAREGQAGAAGRPGQPARQPGRRLRRIGRRTNKR